MTSDFRTAYRERRVQNRISYLETLMDTTSGEEERDKLRSAIAEHQAMLDEIRAEAAKQSPISSSVMLPPPMANGEPHSYPVYVPPVRVLQRWRSEARLAMETDGDRDDSHRRVLVLLELAEDLLRILAEEEVKLVPVAKPSEHFSHDDREPALSTDEAP